jgi:hypothetical protein
LGCRQTLALIRDVWEAESPVFGRARVMSPPNPHPDVFPVLSREYLEGWEYSFTKDIQYDCGECK